MFRLLIYIFCFAIFFPLELRSQEVEKTDSIKSQKLQEVTVSAKRKQDVGIEKVGQIQLSTEMTSDMRDLVRYIPGVGISYSGTRGGSRGFAIRGVEANRVAISVDGIPQPEIHENIVFSAYGLSNASRIEFDPYFVSGIDIQKGASSFNSGTGALGGAVNYTPKRISDLIKPGNKAGGMLQAMYNGKDNLRMLLGGVGVRSGKFKGLAMFASRYGDEIKNFEYGDLTRNVTSTRVDPMDYKQQTFLAKIAFIPNSLHRLEFTYYMLNKKMDSEIWSQEPLDIFTSDGKPYYYSHDQTLNHSYTLNYNYMPESQWADRLNIRANLQNTYMDAKTWSEYYRPNFYGNGQYELIYEGRRDKYQRSTTHKTNISLLKFPLNLEILEYVGHGSIDRLDLSYLLKLRLINLTGTNDVVFRLNVEQVYMQYISGVLDLSGLQSLKRIIIYTAPSDGVLNEIIFPQNLTEDQINDIDNSFYTRISVTKAYKLTNMPEWMNKYITYNH